jgi:hypothetical protein
LVLFLTISPMTYHHILLQENFEMTLFNPVFNYRRVNVFLSRDEANDFIRNELTFDGETQIVETNEVTQGLTNSVHQRFFRDLLKQSVKLPLTQINKLARDVLIPC